MATITAKIQIYVLEEQAKRLISTVRAYGNACNFLSEKVFVSKELNQVNLNNLYYKDMRFSFSFPVFYRSLSRRNLERCLFSRQEETKTH